MLPYVLAAIRILGLYVNAGFSTQVMIAHKFGWGEEVSTFFDESGCKWNDECEVEA
jgi:uncharacterized glyoxalase superfamily protein PhnB